MVFQNVNAEFSKKQPLVKQSIKYHVFFCPSYFCKSKNVIFGIFKMIAADRLVLPRPLKILLKLRSYSIYDNILI